MRPLGGIRLRWQRADGYRVLWRRVLGYDCAFIRDSFGSRADAVLSLIISAASVQRARGSRFVGRRGVDSRSAMLDEDIVKRVFQMFHGIRTGANITSGQQNKHTGPRLLPQE